MCSILGSLQNGVAAPRSKARVPPASDTLGFGQKYDATVDIPLDTMNVRKLLCDIHSAVRNTRRARLLIVWYVSVGF